jgi:hypothetical protein
MVMRTAPFLAIAAFLSFLAGYSAGGQDTNKITATINFVSVPVRTVLQYYEPLIKSKLVVASDVRRVTQSITLHAAAVPPEVARQMIQQALLKQARVVITRLDDKRVSVTFNDALELQP